MSFAPYAAIWLVLVAAALLLFLTARRTTLQIALSLAAPLLGLALWLPFRPDDSIPALALAGQQWAITEAAWSLTGALLLLLLAAAAHFAVGAGRGAGGRDAALTTALVTAALPALWAADDRTRILGVAFFALAWGAALYVERGQNSLPILQRLSPALRVLAAVFPLWLAAVLPVGRVFFAMLAGAVLLGVWPFAFGRDDEPLDPQEIFQRGLAALIGGAILAAAVQTRVPTSFELAAGTAFGLISMVVGLTRVWGRPLGNNARVFAMALGGLALVAALWAGADALVAGIRLAVFVPVLLVTVASGKTTAGARSSTSGNEPAPARFRLSPALLVALVVFAAIGGLPLTAGFATLAPLYTVWSVPAGWVLLVITAALLALWLAAVVVGGRTLLADASNDRAEWLATAAGLPAVVGLFAGPGSLGDVGVAAWIALAVPLVAGPALGLFAPGVDRLGDLLREAATFPAPAERLAPTLRRARQTAADAVGDALAILEGEYGLLWLLGIVLLLFWLA